MENNNIPRRTPEEFNLYLQHKNARINYYHSQGRISNKEYEKWILSEDVEFEPVVKSKEDKTIDLLKDI